MPERKSLDEMKLQAIARDLPIVDVMHDLLGCQWGRGIATEDDTEPCFNEAVRMVALHDGAETAIWKLCQRHLQRLSEETVPHAS
jgi:hypothetical protein